MNYWLLLLLVIPGSFYAAERELEREFRWAVVRGLTKSLPSMLCENPRLINVRLCGENTALMYAVTFERFATAEYLLMSGADVNTQMDGETALYRAVSKGKPEFVELLLRHGADISLQKNDGETPYLRVLSYIKAHGPSYEQSFSRFSKGYWTWRSENLQEIKKLLEQHGARLPEEKKK